jgi:hypothetical protein
MGGFHVYEIYTGLQLLETPGCRREREREVSKAKSWGSCGKAKALLCISFFLGCMFHSSSGRVSAADATLGIIAYYYEHSSFSRFFLLVCEGFSTFAGF